MDGVVVYLISTAPASMPPSAPLTAEIDQQGLRFVPGVIAVSIGSTVSFPNSDPVMHNVFSPSRGSRGFDLGTYPQGERRSFTFDDEGVHVIFCHVHPEMVGYVVVVASPYRTVTDDHGRFTLAGVASGQYHLRTWHRRLRTQEREITVADNGAVRLDLTLEYGVPSEPRSTQRRPR